VTKTFNPEAQCFRPIDSVSCSLNNLSLSPSKSLGQFAGVPNGNGNPAPAQIQVQQVVQQTGNQVSNNLAITKKEILNNVIV